MARLKSEKDEISGKLDAKYWVEKSDPVALMRSVPFSLGELKILDTYISRINPADETRRTVIFTKEEYEELMGLTCVDYRTLQKHTKGMLGKVVELQMPNKDYLQFVLFTKAHYHKDEYGKPIIELTCTEEAKNLFFFIKEDETKYHYFKYALDNVINLNRKASYLLYLYIRYNRYRGSWDLPLDELRDTVLDCKSQESYKEFKIFKNRILDPAVKEVNTKTDCHFEYEVIKRGRKVAKIRFIYHSEEQLEGQLSFNDPQLPTDHNEDEDAKWIQIYGSEELATLAESCNYEFIKEEMLQVLAVLHRIDIQRDLLTNDITWGRYRYLKEKYAALNAADAKKKLRGEKPIKNRFTYFMQILENDTFQSASS